MARSSDLFECTHSADFPDLLTQLDCTLVLSTHPAGKVVFLSADKDGLIQHPNAFQRPTAMAVNGKRLTIATEKEVVVVADAPALARGDAVKPVRQERVFPVKGSDLGEIAWGDGGLWAVNRRLSCLGLIDEKHGFRAQWQPSFITDLSPDDRCHLNGMAMVDGEPVYVTALGHTNIPGGWREKRLSSGIMMDTGTGEIIVHGLSLPHSPRVFDSTIYFLNSATGDVMTVDPATGTCETVNRVEGFARGFARYGDYLFVGISRIRKKHLFGHMPVARKDVPSGLVLVHVPTGLLAGKIQYLTGLDEIFDVQVLPGLIRIPLANELNSRRYWQNPMKYLSKGIATAALSGALLLGVPSLSRAVGPFVEVSAGENPLNAVDVGDYSNPAFVDIDNDGDFDAFIGENLGNINYFENTGTNSDPQFVERTGTQNPFNGVDVGSSSTPAFVDIDGDGDFDAFIGEFDGTINYFENTGTSSAPAFIERTGTQNPFDGVDVGDRSTPAFVDIDGDGDFDAFIGHYVYYGYSYNASVRYFENTGNSSNPQFVEKTGTQNPLSVYECNDHYCQSAPTFVDIDGDGDFDAFIGEYDGAIKYFENTGTSSAPAFTEQTGNQNPLNAVDVGGYSTPAFVDIDNDGDFDAFIGEHEGTINYFENTGTNSDPQFIERTGNQNPLNVDVGYNSTPAFVDIDGDGDFDAFIGHYDYLGSSGNASVRYFENTGISSNPQFVEKTGTQNPLSVYVCNDYYCQSAPTFVDIDGDGDFDAFIGDDYGKINYFENTGTNSDPQFVERTGMDNPFDGVDVGWHSTPAFVDIDNDGDFDAFFGEWDGAIKYFENTGTNSDPQFIERTGSDNPLNAFDVGRDSAPAFVDIDGDGDFDAFIGEHDGTIKYFKNTGSISAPAFVERTGSDNPLNTVDVGDRSTPAFVDIDGDGDFDAFIGEYDGNINYFRNDEPAQRKAMPWLLLLLGD